MVKDRWSTMLSRGLFLALIVAPLLSASAWSLSLSAPEESDMTTVTRIISPREETTSIEKAEAGPGYMGVEAIYSLNRSKPPATVSMPQASSIQPVSMMTSPPPTAIQNHIPTMIVFPVMIHKAKDKAFADLPLMFSTSLANQLADTFYKTGVNISVVNPVYAYDDLAEKGLDGLYNRLTRDFLQAGQPNERDILYLAEKLSTSSKPVEWIAFVQADFDATRLTKPVGLEIPMAMLLNRPPREANYFLKGWVQFYSAREGVPLLWSGAASSRVRLSEFGNFTKSVYDDSDSALNFKVATGKMAQEVISAIPEDFYGTFAQVHATLVPGPEAANITPKEQELLKQILRD